MFVDATSFRAPERLPAVQIPVNNAQYPPAVTRGLNGWNMPSEGEMNGAHVNGTHVNGAHVNGSGGANGHVSYPLSSNGGPVNGVPTNGHAASGSPGNDALDDADPMVTERRRLEADLAAVRQQIVDARSLLAQREATTTEAVRVELESSRAAIAELDRRHADALSIVRSAGRAEVDSILAEARRHAAGLVAAPVPDDPATDSARGTGSDAF